MDDTDYHETECALRETEEEIGLSPEFIDVSSLTSAPKKEILKVNYFQIWGTGSQIISRAGPSIVPIIAEIKNFKPEMLKKNPDEVEKIFTVSLDRLRDPQLVRHTQFRGKFGYSMPVYLGGDMKFWGMTATVTHFLLCSLLPKTLYNRRMPYVNKYELPT
jgi:nudix motif 8